MKQDEANLEANGVLMRLIIGWANSNLPVTASNPAQDRLPEFSPSYNLINAQVTHVYFSSNFENICWREKHW